jgi:hypothetical protein
MGDGQQRVMNCQVWCKMHQLDAGNHDRQQGAIRSKSAPTALVVLNSPAITIAAIKSLEYN